MSLSFYMLFFLYYTLWFVLLQLFCLYSVVTLW